MSDRFPIRADTHVIDEKGQRLLRNTLPDDWKIDYFSNPEYGIDFMVEIPEEKQMKGNLFFSQLKTHEKIPNRKNSTISQYIEYKNWNYWKDITLPFFLFVADLSREKIFWINVRKTKLEKKEGQAGTTLRIPTTNDLSVKNSLNELIADVLKEKELKRLAELKEFFPRLFLEPAEESQILFSTSGRAHQLTGDEIKCIHLFLDDYNNHLDNNFPILKEKFLPDIWKIGILVSKTPQRLFYSLYPINWDSKSPSIIEISTDQWERLFHHGRFSSGSVEWEYFLHNYHRIVAEYIENTLKRLFEKKELNHTGNEFLAREVVFHFTHKFHVQLGLQKKESYEVNDIEFAFKKYLPFWIQEAMKTVSKNILSNLTSKSGYIDIDFLSNLSHSYYQEQIQKNITKRFDDEVPIPVSMLRIADNENIPLSVFDELLTYLKSREIKKVERLYKPPDWSRSSGYIYSKFSPEDLHSNLQIYFRNIIPVYNKLVENNFPKLKDRLEPFHGASKILFQFGFQDHYAFRDMVYLKGDYKGSMMIDVFPKGEGRFPKKTQGFDELFFYEGKPYQIIEGRFGILDFIFEEPPMFKGVYDLIRASIGDHFGFNSLKMGTSFC